MWGLLPIESKYLACLAVNTYAVRGRTNVLRGGSGLTAQPRSLGGTELVRSKFFLLFVEKIEKLKPSLSKQHNKMLKIKSEMLKIRKNVKIIKLEKIFSENFRCKSHPC